eukprot:72573_1
MCNMFHYMICILQAIAIATLSFNDTMPLFEYIVTEQTEVYYSNHTMNNITCIKPSCTIICDGVSACDDIFIDGSESQTLKVICSLWHACNYVYIIAGGQNRTNIDCKGGGCWYSIFNVANSKNVNLNCSDTYSCNLIELDATHSSNVTVMCWSNRYAANYEACWRLEIYCPVNGFCSYVADSYGSRDTMILIYKDTHLDISAVSGEEVLFCNTETDEMLIWHYTDYVCTQYGWEFIYRDTLDCSEQSSICHIDCNAQNCVKYLIDGKAASTALIVDCKHNPDVYVANYTGSGCKDATIICTANCTVNCLGFSACVALEIISTDMSFVNVNCYGYHACNNMLLDASNSYLLELNCVDGEDVCSHADVYCPFDTINACNINCIGDIAIYDNLCDLMLIIVEDHYTYDYLSLSSPADETIKFECDNKTYAYFIGEYRCNLQSSQYCCPWWGPIVCDVDACSIDCSNKDMRRCKETMVNATLSHSLTIICDIGNTCANTIIYCGVTYCNITCVELNGCNGAIIYANMTTDVVVNCFGANACDNIIIYAQYSLHFTFNSTSLGSYYATLYVEYVNIIHVYCEYDRACNYINIYADNTASIVLMASHQYGLANNILFASDAQFISVMCRSEGDDYSCYNNQLYLPDMGYNTTIQCYGTACHDFGEIYVGSSVAAMHLNTNGCDECDSRNDCLGTWTIFCNESVEFDIFNGENCRTSQCDCLEFISNMKFENNADNSNCPILRYKTERKLLYHFLWLLLIPIIVIGIYVGRNYWQTFVVDNMLVLIIGITHFDDKTMDLPQDKKNILKLKKLWSEIYNYQTFVCNEDEETFYCTQMDVVDFITNHKKRLRNKTFNGVLVHILSHGTNNEYFKTSDMKDIQISLIQEQLIDETDNLDIIKIICHHACRGGNVYHNMSEIETITTTGNQCCTCCSCFGGKYTENDTIKECVKNETEMTTMKPIDHEESTDEKSESMYRGGVNLTFKDKVKTSEYSNSIIIYQNIKGRANSSKGFFTDCIYDAFVGNLRKFSYVNKQSLIGLIRNIARKLEQITKSAEICTTLGIATLRYKSIIFERANGR